jgi:subtilisin family serine protease
MKRKNTFQMLRNPLILLVLVTMLAGIYSCQKDRPSEISSAQEQEEAALVSFSYEVIPDKYIVVLDEEKNNYSHLRRSIDPEQFKAIVSETSVELVIKHADVASVNAIEHVYSSAVCGFSVKLDAEAVAKLKLDPRVAYIEQDMEIKLGISNNGKGKPGGGGGDSEPPPPSSQTIPYGVTRVKGKAYTGTNIVFIIDTGVQLDHNDLNVDASKGFNAFTKGKDGGSLTDYNGHGTHVAGTVAAIDNTYGVIGVAAGATVVPVKVLDSRGSGTISGVIAGVDHVANVGNTGDVANMSLGGGASSALDNAVIAASAKVKFAIAAGNSSANAANYSPARANGTNIFTVSAMNSSNNWASFSNFGNPPIDFCSPGVNIESTWIGNSYHTISGTSMAAPHVAGILLHGSWKTDGTVNGDPDGNPDPIGVVN